MSKSYAALFLLSALIFSCSIPKSPIERLWESLDELPQLTGKSDYLKSRFTAAGDRLYLIGNQDGSFPDMGWHVEGEMGGIWMHPIKLIDGFTASISSGETSICLDEGKSFTNYPMTNAIEFDASNLGLEIDRLHVVPDGKPGIVVLFQIKNVDKSEKPIRFQFNTYVDLMPVWLGERTGMIDSTDVISFDEQTQTFTGKDLGNNWFTVWGSSNEFPLNPSKVSCGMNPKGKGAVAGAAIDLIIQAGESVSIPIFISGSDQSNLEAVETFADLKSTYVEDFFSKKSRFEKLLQTAAIQIPDQELQQAYEWIKYNTDWLVRDVPGVGRGFGAGLQDYPW
jgi:hypothetical protein